MDSGIVLDQARHYMRAVRVEDGEKPADVARSEGVTVRAIEKSIRIVKYQKSLYTQANFNMALMGMMLGQLPKVKETFDRMFAAKDYVERKNADGSTELIPVDDKTIQMEALKTFATYTTAMQPKGGGVNVRVQQNNANQANATATGKGGFESMLHQVIKEANNHAALPSVTADVIDDEDFSEESQEDGESLTA